jgi:hypothetical protein
MVKTRTTTSIPLYRRRTSPFPWMINWSRRLSKDDER